MEARDFIKKLNRIEFHTRLKSREALAGTYHSAFKGQGMTFSECKAYEEGDDVRYIDWHATARQQGIFVKQFIEERELSVCIILDLSMPMHFGSLGMKKYETGIEAMSILALSALQNNDKVALFMFDEKGMKIIPPLKGKGNTVRLIIEALKFKPETPSHGLSSVMTKAMTLMKRRNLVFIISDFLHGNYEDVLRHMNHHHEVIPVVVSDPMESTLPDLGITVIKDLVTGEFVLVDTSLPQMREYYAEQFEARIQMQKQLFDRHKLTTVRISTTDDILKPITGAFNRRASHV